MSGVEGRVAIVTGAGGGLGREHALLLADRGALVVVNDIGAGVDGTGADASPAQKVVGEIEAAGGTAVANHDSVTTSEGGEAIVAAAVEAFGTVDIVVNNAGILRDSSFHKLADDALDAVVDVHLRGAFNVTRPAWRHMREQGYGRVVTTTSAAGILGNFGQANYAAAKAALVGLTNVLAVEGERSGITANAIAPVARTRMTEDLLGKLTDKVEPRLVSPLVAWLASEACTTTGATYTVGGGRVARFFVGMTDGWTRTDGDLTVEDVEAHWEEINDLQRSTPATSLADDFRALRRALA
jgi:NAD(P)-dependent dehydrogenase (short-subunit alcohol dehydrogenase family)